MFIYTLKFDRRVAVFTIIMISLILIGIIVLIGAHQQKESIAEPTVKTTGIVKNEKSRVAYLKKCGWDVETPALSESTIVIPRSFSQVFEEYNELQKQQGFDLSQYCGMEVELYTYKVINVDETDGDVLAELYVKDGKVIGGDVHSTRLDGYIKALQPKP